MTQRKETAPYLRKIFAAHRSGKIRSGQVTEVVVYHDDHCRLLAGRGPCNCNPDVRLITTATSAQTTR